MSTPSAADFLDRFARSRGFSRGVPVGARVTPDGAAVLFLRSDPFEARQDLYELDLASGAVRCLVRADQVGDPAEGMTPEERARRERLRVTATGFVDFDLSPDGRFVLLPLAGHVHLFDRQAPGAPASARRALLPEYGDLFDPRFVARPGGGLALAFVRDNDLWCASLLEPALAADPPRRITPGGTVTCFHARAEFVAQEEMGRSQGYWFSPDGATALATRVDETNVEILAVADPADPARPPQGLRYPRPGRANADVTLWSYAVDGARAPVEIAWDRARHPYLARVSWEAGAPPLLLVQARDQREAVLLVADPDSGATREILRERDPAWLNLKPRLPRVLPDEVGGAAVAWPSERSGRFLLERWGLDGQPRPHLVGPELLGPEEEFLALLDVTTSAPARALVLVGDALSSRILEVSLATGSSPRELCGGLAEHASTGPAHADALVVLRTEAAAWPRVQVRARADGRVLAEVPSVAADPGLEVGLELTRVELTAIAESPPRVLHAALLRPRDFNPARRYPVVVHVYGGPHAQLVRRDRRFYLLDQWLADQGVVVVCLDGRGTPRRGRVWERAIQGHLGPLALADQVDGLRALACRYPELDLDRVGIHGWSFGGTMAALAVLLRGDLFKVAVAGAPVIDWLDYDTHYTERYLGLPGQAPEAYRHSSPLHHVAPLRPGQPDRPLLLIHGTADDNVYFAHSLKLAQALLRAGRRFDFLPLPGVTHQVGDAALSREVWRRTADYLLRHL